MKTDAQGKLYLACGKELAYVKKQEIKFHRDAYKQEQAIKKKISEKIPDALEEKLELAFCKAFEIIFTKGTGLLEKTYSRKNIMDDYTIRDFTVNVKGTRGELKKFRQSGSQKQNINMAITTVEGLGLGVLGIGLPDIVGFMVVLLRGIYEICLQYGFDYTKPEEKYLILKMMECSLSKKEEFTISDKAVDELLLHPVCKESIEIQARKTAKAMALDMLCLKFIQGFPIVGILGGAGNPVYCNKIMKYVRLKYYKRYLLKKINHI